MHIVRYTYTLQIAREQIEDSNMTDIQRTDQDITTEIQTLSGFIDELNYYEMFCLSPDCVQSDIPVAYKTMTDRFNPSQLSAPSEEITEQGDYLMLSLKKLSTPSTASPLDSSTMF